jgi:hypothetical protein
MKEREKNKKRDLIIMKIRQILIHKHSNKKKIKSRRMSTQTQKSETGS